MKKILMLAVAFVSLFAVIGCGPKVDENPLVKGMVGQWQMTKSSLRTSSTKDKLEIYVEFKADNTFDLYQKDLNEPVYFKHYSGTYLITGDIVTGQYSDGKSWGATNGYKTELNMAGELSMTNVDVVDDITVYAKKDIPASVISAATRAAVVEVAEDDVRFL